MSVLCTLLFTSVNDSTDDRLYDGGTLPEVIITECINIPSNMLADYYLLSRLVHSESGHEPFEGKLAVANVVLNIAAYKGLTITETIYLPGIFDGIKHPVFNKAPNDASMRAARMALSGVRVIPAGVLYFFNPRVASDTKWIRRIKGYSYKKIGNHLFCWEPALYNK